MSEDLFYQHVVVRGLPYKRGFSYGSQTRDKIQRNIEYYKQADKLGPWSVVSTVISECYIPGLQRYWPSGWEEMRGVAAGAGVAVEDIVLLNARYDLSHVKFDGALPAQIADECTSAIVLGPATADRSVYTAQNWDMSHRLVAENGVVYLEIHPDSSEGIPSMFIVTEAGQLGRSGCNSAGLGLTANSLQSDMDTPPDTLKRGPVPPSGALRRLFLEQSDYAAGIKAIARTPRHVSFNLMVSSADNIGLCLEVTPKTIFRSTTSSNEVYMVHANHFQTAAFQSQTQLSDTYQGGSSWYRGERLEAGLRERGIKGSLREDDIVAALSDHAGYPFSLCEHFIESRAHKQEQRGPYSGPTSTVCCVVYNLSQRTVRVCKGCPCEGEFQIFRLE
ncbi:acyl-coenzyme A:6-aminopenicillanic acid acyl-transferase-domain-containing protein [Aspergillus pseudoustus]|uniref:Acyl-coenzyme A:6-aminopenicillanic acid acyl-transferase-domain-containing protein n=1 Tax=Aspergillus pseudoustus TaxID=1810923 RepID=A0ABR4K9D0_9EURO